MAALHHVGATVTDLSRSVRFYVDLLGCEVLDEIASGADPRVRDLVGVPDASLRGTRLRVNGSVTLELLQYDTSYARVLATMPCDTPGIHLAFAIDDPTTVRSRVIRAGGAVIGGPVRFGSTTVVYGRDPDGNVLELVHEGGPEVATCS